MTLRKKFSRKLLKTQQPPLEEQLLVPPTPSASRVVQIKADDQILPAVRPTSPLLSSSPLLTSRTNPHTHRRSRSFSALTSGAFHLLGDLSSPAFRDSAFSQRSNYSTTSIDQPWRSHDAWKALYGSPFAGIGHVSELTHPSALPEGSGGWRGTAGKGFFAGNRAPRPRRQSLKGDSLIQDESHRRESTYKLQSPRVGKRSSEFSTSPLSKPLPLKSAFIPARPEANSPEVPRDSWQCHEQSLLPPLLPTTVQRLPPRASSFASLRPTLHSPTFNPTGGSPHARFVLGYDHPSTGCKAKVEDRIGERLLATPIPWGRRTTSPRRSASPPFAKQPVPARPPRRMDHEESPESPMIDFSAPVPVTEDNLIIEADNEDKSASECSGQSEDASSRGASPVRVRERLTTPVTPPGAPRRGDRISAKGWEARERFGTRGSWDTVEVGGRTRGGWI